MLFISSFVKPGSISIYIHFCLIKRAVLSMCSQQVFTPLDSYFTEISLVQILKWFNLPYILVEVGEISLYWISTKINWVPHFYVIIYSKFTSVKRWDLPVLITILKFVSFFSHLPNSLSYMYIEIGLFTSIYIIILFCNTAPLAVYIRMKVILWHTGNSRFLHCILDCINSSWILIIACEGKVHFGIKSA